MRTHEEFEAWLEETLLPRLAEEQQAAYELRDRRLAVQTTLRTKVAFIAAGVVAAVLLRSFDLLVVAFSLPFAIDLYRRSRIQSSTCDVRRTFLEPIVRFFGPEFGYVPHGRLTRADLDATGLFAESYDEVASTDRVTGTVGETAFRFTEIRLLRQRKKEGPENVYTGILFEADANKEFQGSVYVLPDQSEALLGLLGRSLQGFRNRGRGELVQLEDPEFERAFQVFADDQVEARYLLSPALMRRLLALRENYGGEVRVAFKEGRLWMALELVRDFFTVPGSALSWVPGVGESVLGLDADVFRSWANDILTITGLVEDLDLDTRIWSKAG